MRRSSELRSGRRLAGALAVVALAAAVIAAPAATGPTFPVNGTSMAASAYTPGSNDGAEAVAVQPDGKILAAGVSASSWKSTNGFPPYDVALARYRASGRLDTTFGAGGRVLTGLGSTYDYARAVAIQPDGKIVVVGDSGPLPPIENWVPEDFLVMRYTSAGTLDSSFGTGGRVSTAVGSGSDDMAYAVALQPDGKIVVAGSSGPAQSDARPHFALARYTDEGRLDPSFGDGGIVLTDFGSGRSSATAVAVQPDGKIVAAGSGPGEDGDRFALVRYTAGGALDPAFGSGGRILTGFRRGDYGHARGMALQRDGKIVVAGESEVVSGDEDSSLFALARYTGDGSLDPNFGNGGQVLTSFGSGWLGIAHDVTIQDDGRIVALGDGDQDENERSAFAVARYTPDGRLDASFGSGGKVLTEFGQQALVFGMAVVGQADGKLIAAGYSYLWGSDFTLARYTVRGRLDPSFGTGGRLYTDFATSTTGFSATRTKTGVQVAWRTDAEVGLRGFYVYRDQKRVTTKLIRSKGSPTRGAAYSLVDRGAAKSTRYWLQEVKLNGQKVWAGPAVVRP